MILTVHQHEHRLMSAAPAVKSHGIRRNSHRRPALFIGFEIDHLRSGGSHRSSLSSAELLSLHRCKHRVKGRLCLKISSKKQRIRAPSPGSVVRQSPEGHGSQIDSASALLQKSLEEIIIELRLMGLRHAAGSRLPDVQLRDMNQMHRLIIFSERPDILVQILGIVQVSLHADPIQQTVPENGSVPVLTDRETLGHGLAGIVNVLRQETDDGAAAFFIPFIVIIVKKQRADRRQIVRFRVQTVKFCVLFRKCKLRFPGKEEAVIEIFRPDDPVPGASPQTIRLPLIRSLIYHIPGIDHIRKAICVGIFQYPVNIGAEPLNQGFPVYKAVLIQLCLIGVIDLSTRQGLKIFRENGRIHLAVPDQHMAAHGHPVIPGPGQKLLRCRVHLEQGRRRRIKIVGRLQLISKGHAVEAAPDQILLGLISDLRRRIIPVINGLHRYPDPEIILIRFRQ